MTSRRIPEGAITKGLRAPVRAERFHDIALSLKGRKPLADEHMDVRSGSPKPITSCYESADCKSPSFELDHEGKPENLEDAVELYKRVESDFWDAVDVTSRAVRLALS